MRLPAFCFPVVCGALLLASIAHADEYYDESFEPTPEAFELVMAWGNPEHWVTLTTVTVRFSPGDTFLTRSIPLPRSLEARAFKFLLNPRFAEVSSVTADDELLAGPVDKAGSVFPTASGGIETFGRELRITLTKSPSAEAETANLRIFFTR